MEESREKVAGKTIPFWKETPARRRAARSSPSLRRAEGQLAFPRPLFPERGPGRPQTSRASSRRRASASSGRSAYELDSVRIPAPEAPDLPARAGAREPHRRRQAQGDRVRPSRTASTGLVALPPQKALAFEWLTLQNPLAEVRRAVRAPARADRARA
ncbi:MAG: hypothetical protein MZU95_01635 [Desulfomicrobium escambiense]|nr:hypothetical protein [Desulfomicrobium escambiense]